jgi:hypothetical protein
MIPFAFRLYGAWREAEPEYLARTRGWADQLIRSLAYYLSFLDASSKIGSLDLGTFRVKNRELADQAHALLELQNAMLQALDADEAVDWEDVGIVVGLTMSALRYGAEWESACNAQFARARAAQQVAPPPRHPAVPTPLDAATSMWERQTAKNLADQRDILTGQRRPGTVGGS